MAPQRIGLIGTGDQARSYGAHIAANPRQFTFAAVASKSQDRMNSYADEFGVPAGARYENTEALVDSGVPLDGLIITSPDTTHEEVALASMKLRIPLLLEKPIADSVGRRLPGGARRRVCRSRYNSGTRAQIYAPSTPRSKS